MDDPVFDAFLSISEHPRSEWPALVARRFPAPSEQRRELERMLAASLADKSDTDVGGKEKLLPNLPPPPEVTEESVPEIANVQLFEVLGRGSAGVVYRGRQSAPVAREVAVKVFHRDSVSSGFIRREAGVLARLNHPQIAAIHSVGTCSDGRAFSILEYVNGGTILDYVRGTPLSLRELLRLFAQLCDGVAHANESGVVHRDLKPANVLVGTLDGRPVVKVLDFSIASALTLDEESTLTLNGLSVGTPRYMSPEQIDPSIGGTSTRTDVFALGVMLHELLVGCHPHIGERRDDTTLFTVLQDMRTALPQLPSAHLKQRTRDGRQGVEGVHWTSSELVNDLDAIVHCALQPKPADRYASARQLGNDIERFLTGDPVSARTPTAMQRVRRQVRRHPVFAASAVFATLLVIVTVASTSISAYRLYLSSMREATAHAQTRMALVASAASDGDYALASAQLSSVDPEFRDGTWGVLAGLLDQSEHSVLLDEQGIAAIWMGSDAAYIAGRSGSVWWVDLDSPRFKPALLASGLGAIDRIWGPGSRSHFVIVTTDGTFEWMEGTLALADPSFEDHRNDGEFDQRQQRAADSVFRLTADGTAIEVRNETDSSPLAALRGHTNAVVLPQPSLIETGRAFVTGDESGVVKRWKLPPLPNRGSEGTDVFATASGWQVHADDHAVFPNQVRVETPSGLWDVHGELPGAVSLASTTAWISTCSDRDHERGHSSSVTEVTLQRRAAVTTRAVTTRSPDRVWYPIKDGRVQMQSVDVDDARTFDIERGRVTAMAADSDGVVAVAGTTLVRLAADGTLHELGSVPMGIQLLSTNARHILASTTGGTVVLVSRETHNRTTVLLGSGIRSAIVLQDDDIGLIGTDAGIVHIIDLQRGARSASVPIFDHAVGSMAEGDDGLVRVASADGRFSWLRPAK